VELRHRRVRRTAPREGGTRSPGTAEAEAPKDAAAAVLWKKEQELLDRMQAIAEAHRHLLKEDIRAVQGGFPTRHVIPVRIDGLPDDARELALSRLLDEYRTVREERFASTCRKAQASAGLLVVGLQQRLRSRAR
jgi:hypothetical protein